MAAGIRPSAMILQEQPTEPWVEFDFILLEAYQILESERCPQCGLPIYICHSEDEAVQFRVWEDTCAAKYKVETTEESITKKGKKPMPKATILRQEPYMVDGRDLIELRQPYYEAEAAKREAVEKSRLNEA